MLIHVYCQIYNYDIIKSIITKQCDCVIWWYNHLYFFKVTVTNFWSLYHYHYLFSNVVIYGTLRPGIIRLVCWWLLELRYNVWKVGLMTLSLLNVFIHYQVFEYMRIVWFNTSLIFHTHSFIYLYLHTRQSFFNLLRLGL